MFEQKQAKTEMVPTEDGDEIEEEVEEGWHNKHYSFQKNLKKTMTYGELLHKIQTEKRPGSFVLRDSRTIDDFNYKGELKLELDEIRKDLVEPEFYSNFALLETIELI